MLNAFRHQRSNLLPRMRPRRNGASPVLNAFRHQRSNLLSILTHIPRSTMCSTPFGIKDQISRIMPSGGASCLCAQRLSASKIKSLPGLVTMKRFITVLNAFRHQRSNLPPHKISNDHKKLVLNAFRHQRSNLTGGARQ